MQEMDVGTTSLASRRICMIPGTERAGGTGKSQPTFSGKVGSALQGVATEGLGEEGHLHLEW